MIIGSFRYPIVVKGLTIVKDADNGSETPVYTIKHKLKAAMKADGGSQIISDKEIFTQFKITFTTHYRKDIVDTDRIEFKGYTYKILMIAEVAYREGLTLVCESVNL